MLSSSVVRHDEEMKERSLDGLRKAGLEIPESG
jgi:hypothetical protein